MLAELGDVCLHFSNLDAQVVGGNFDEFDVAVHDRWVQSFQLDFHSLEQLVFILRGLYRARARATDRFRSFLRECTELCRNNRMAKKRWLPAQETGQYLKSNNMLDFY